MRRFAPVFSLATVVACSASAQDIQLSLGARAGANTSWFANDRHDSRRGSVSAFFATLQLGPVLALQSEVGVSEKGWGGENTTQTQFVPRTHLKYLEAPVLLRFTPTARWPFQPYAIAGFAYAWELSCEAQENSGPIFALSSRTASDLQGFADPGSCERTYPDRAKYDRGFVTGIGVLRHLGEMSLVLELRRTRGEFDLFNPPPDPALQTPTNSVSAITIGGSYRIK